MSPEELENKIKLQIDENRALLDADDIALLKCLVTPVKQTYSSFSLDERNDYWTVLEVSTDEKGLKIFYNDKTDRFGIGSVDNDDKLISMGFYGTFIQTLKGLKGIE